MRCLFKGGLRSFDPHWFVSDNMNKQSLFVFMTEYTKGKNNYILHCFTLFICGGPCHLFNLKLSNSLFGFFMEKNVVFIITSLTL